MAVGHRKTIHEVAKRAGVSNATVSNVLNGKGRTSREVEQRVRKVARELGYATDRAAAQLRSGRSKIIAALVPSLENPFFTALLAAFERHASQAGYELFVASANEDEDIEASRLAALLSWRPAGVFIVPCTDEFKSSRLLQKQGLPHVVVDRVSGAPRADSILTDNQRAGRDAAAHLYALGHRRIVVAASTLSIANVRERCEGIAEAAEASHAPYADVLEIGKSFDTAAERLKRWVETHRAPDAIIALTNFATLGALSGCARLGLNIPEDVSLVGFDDYAWMGVSSPSITAISQPIDEMGEQAWTSLDERISGFAGPPRLFRLACHLEIRDSAVHRQNEPARDGRNRSAGRSLSEAE
jgi:DNA-binding LacI/PurR family transcriptional regulator